MPAFDIWKIIAGIAVFLLAINFMEEALNKLAGRPFKLFLKKQTSNPARAVVAGVVVTAILQSSSVVNLMILAFVGAGVIKMKNALAVILGANLGTTVSNWLIVAIGFQFNLESLVFPVIGIAGIAMGLTNTESRWFSRSKLLLGFGFLFLGLDFIKTGMGEVVTRVDFNSLAQYPLIAFFVVGFVITALIQSSTATVAIVLSALHAEAIGFTAATAIVLGSEVGTSLKLVLASVRGLAIKKRIALGNVLFNLLPGILIYTLLVPINHFIKKVVHIEDNLLALVFFQTFINISGILLFFPFLNRFGKFLEKQFSAAQNETLFIHKTKVTDADLAIGALEKETKQFIYYVAEFVLAAFNTPVPAVHNLPVSKEYASKSLTGKYEFIKHLHGEMNEFCVQLRNHITDKESTTQLEQMIASCRNAMYAAKNIKDAMHDIDQLRNSSNNVKYDFYKQMAERVAHLYRQILPLLSVEKPGPGFEKLTLLFTSIQDEYVKVLQELYKTSGTAKLAEIEFSTLINFNREMYTSFKSILFSLKDYLLNEKEAGYFDELPGFIR